MEKLLNRQAQLQRFRRRYAGRGKEGKSRLLDEFCEQYGYERIYASKLLNASVPSGSGAAPPGPEPKYQPVLEVVAAIWEKAEQLCGKRLAPALSLWLPHYERHFGKLLPSQKKLLGDISPATLDRLLASRKTQLRGLSGTRPGTLLRHQVPIQGEVWDERRLGFLEADSVAHCGASLAGNFIWSLVYTDLCSGWTEGRAVWNKGATGVVERTRHVEQVLPFPLLGFDFDNGSEWLNWTLIHYLQVRARPVRVTRSRPYHSDDNAHVEQKNWMWPRQLLGYSRLEAESLVEPINDLYVQAWGPLQNFFLPSMKLIKKWRVGSRWKRRHDPPQTPYQRILASQQLPRRRFQLLRAQYQSFDPFVLAAAVETRLKTILQRKSHLTNGFSEDKQRQPDTSREGTGNGFTPPAPFGSNPGEKHTNPTCHLI